MHYALKVEGETKMNLASPASAAQAARSIDPLLDPEHVVRELGEHGIFVLPRHHGIRITRQGV